MGDTIYTYRVADKLDLDSGYKWYARCSRWGDSLDKRIVKAVEGSIKDKGSGTYSYGDFTFKVAEKTSSPAVSNKQICENYRDYLDKLIKQEKQEIGVDTLLNKLEELKKEATGEPRKSIAITKKPKIDEEAILRRIAVPAKRSFSDTLEDITVYQNTRVFINSFTKEIVNPYEALLTSWFEKEVLGGKPKKEFKETVYGQYIVNGGDEESDMIDAYLIVSPEGDWATVVEELFSKIGALKVQKISSAQVLELKKGYDALIKEHVTGKEPKRYYRFSI